MGLVGMDNFQSETLIEPTRYALRRQSNSFVGGGARYRSSVGYNGFPSSTLDVPWSPRRSLRVPLPSRHLTTVSAPAGPFDQQDKAMTMCGAETRYAVPHVAPPPISEAE